ncbi:uncharacterized metal-binding protein [Candidatus Methanoperedens nitroreducens]|uniref:Uncharacterized metal-binding protein n=1 Tax=Candidatus Methanoperedens nitratireducens TaxID=1392998 RepID=A0A062V2P1_9EURY|nr:DUF2227 family putative metal-binding protein [Candidatus Methanoperedens nitroreducens]KCZ73356.1 uncharacterized metal-binding protein [Candidatus Methanoperedens nitroreducens]MDJ1422695.1 DUF2227 family putative metal-binding protein [Candidatus Methanoperedens sp.]
MPNYNTHRTFNYAVFVAITVLLYILIGPALSAINLKYFLALVAGYYIGTDFITPDLDIKSRVIRRWGALRVIWLPYMWIFKHGQSSHNIVYGAVVRMLYLGIIVLGVYYLIFRSLPPDTIISPVYIIIFLAGIIIANALHVILDTLF